MEGFFWSKLEEWQEIRHLILGSHDLWRPRKLDSQFSSENLPPPHSPPFQLENIGHLRPYLTVGGRVALQRIDQPLPQTRCPHVYGYKADPSEYFDGPWAACCPTPPLPPANLRTTARPNCAPTTELHANMAQSLQNLLELLRASYPPTTAETLLPSCWEPNFSPLLPSGRCPHASWKIPMWH